MARTQRMTGRSTPPGRADDRNTTWLTGAFAYYHGALLFLLGSAALVLGYWGFLLHTGAQGQELSFGDLLYRDLQLFFFESGAVEPPLNWPLETARFLAPATTLYAALWALWNIFRRQIRMLYLRSFRGHIVLVGLGRKGYHLARRFQAEGHKVVVLEIDGRNRRLGRCGGRRLITLEGDGTVAADLRRARAHRARFVVATTNDDALNAEVAIAAEDLFHAAGKGEQVCLAHIQNPELCVLLREKELFEERLHRFRLEFFNVYESGARTALDVFPLLGEDPEQEPPRLLVVGAGLQGREIILRAVQNWRRLAGRSGRRLPVTVVDENAGDVLDDLTRQYNRLEQYGRLQAVTTRPSGAPDCWRELDLASARRIIVCLDDHRTGLEVAMAIQHRLRELDLRTPVLVLMNENSGLARLLPGLGEDEGENGNLNAFGVLDEGVTTEVLLRGVGEVLSRAIHECYLEDLARYAGGPKLTGREKKTRRPWAELEAADRDRNREQADRLFQRLQHFHYRIEPLRDWDAEDHTFPAAEVEEMARFEHERWRQAEQQRGLHHAPGPKTGKTNPNLVPWDELTPEIQEMNRQMVRQAPRFLAEAGFQVRQGETETSQG